MKITTAIGTIDDMPMELKSLLLQWRKKLHEAYEDADVKDALILLNEVETDIVDIIVYDRTQFINWLNAGSAPPPPGMVAIISSPACVLHKVKPEEAFWVIATTIDGYIGCFDMVKTIPFNSFGSREIN